MDRKMKIKNIVIVFICTSLLGLICLNIYQHRQIKKRSNVNVPETPSNKAPATNMASIKNIPVEKNSTKEPAIAAKTSGNNESDDLKYHLNAAKEELTMVNQRLSDEETRKAELLKKELELAKKQEEDPANKAAWRTMSKTRLDRQYALLLKMLKLSSEKQEKFMEMLLDEDMASKETGVSVMDDGSGNKRVMNYVRKKDPGDEYQTKISELLGKDDYSNYTSYKSKSREVNELDEFNESLKSNDRLTDDQQFVMVDAMYEKAKKERDATVIDKNKTDITAEINEENNRVYDSYIKAAENILNSSQLEQLKSYLNSKRHSNFITTQLITIEDPAEKKSE